jgi:hypothetical protein
MIETEPRLTQRSYWPISVKVWSSLSPLSTGADQAEYLSKPEGHTKRLGRSLIYVEWRQPYG